MFIFIYKVTKNYYKFDVYRDLVSYSIIINLDSPLRIIFWVSFAKFLENVIEFRSRPKVYYGLTNRPPQNSKHYLAFMFPSITHMYSLILCTHPLAQDFLLKETNILRMFVIFKTIFDGYDYTNS